MEANGRSREFVMKRTVNPKSNLRTVFMKILKRAGIKPWPKLSQNLRSSRSTELITQGFPAYVVAAWLGHSVKVANTHYNRSPTITFAERLTAMEKRNRPHMGRHRRGHGDSNGFLIACRGSSPSVLSPP